MVFIPFSATRHVGMGSPLVHEGSWLGTSRRPSSRSITAAGTGIIRLRFCSCSRAAGTSRLMILTRARWAANSLMQPGDHR